MQKQPLTTWSAVGFAWELGYTIAIPVIVFTLAGRLLDKHFHTHPWLLLIGVFVSLALTTTALVIKASRLMRSIAPDSSKESPPDEPKNRPT